MFGINHFSVLIATSGIESAPNLLNTWSTTREAVVERVTMVRTKADGGCSSASRKGNHLSVFRDFQTFVDTI